MSDQNKEWSVDGYLFQNEQEAQLARKELDGINYLRRMNNMKNPKIMLQVYQKMIEQKMFVTPVGRDYLRNLQKQLKVKFKEEQIPFIPVYGSSEPLNGSTFDSRKKMLEVGEIGNAYKRKFRISLIVNGLFVIAIALMFWLVSTANTPTILNYEQSLIDRYEQWEQELEQREEQLNKDEPRQSRND